LGATGTFGNEGAFLLAPTWDDGSKRPMRSVAFIEEDYLAGLLKDYFARNGQTSYIVTDPAAKRHLKSQGQQVTLPGPNNRSLKKSLTGEKVDLLLIQSDDFERITSALTVAEDQNVRVPTLVISDERDRIAEQAGFVHCITMQELLEGNLRWHILLAQTARRVEEVRDQFENARNVLILLQDDPDPDAIASGLALRHVLDRNRQTATIGSFGRATRPENIAMARLLEIDVAQLHPEDVPEYDRIALVDLQPPHIRTLLPRVDLVVDHHPEQFGYEAKIRDIRPNYGATATILLEYLLATRHSVGQRLATAMLYGIKSDTFLLARETNEWDVEAFSYLYPLANHNVLRRIERPELPPAAIDALGHALKTRHVVNKVAFVHMGQVEREDLIPQIADFSLQFEGIEWAVVSGIFESDLVISVRNVGYVRAAGRVLKDAFGAMGSAGGHASMAKAIVPMSTLCDQWGMAARNTRAINRKLEEQFLSSLNSHSK
jgi:nanoRNase/pAp phosphatase (c-di-AMP/oligoRNAs hydrolase)